MMKDLGPPGGALALHYEGGHAPTLIAEGSGEVARQMPAIAEKLKVPPREDPELLGLLAIVDLGKEIPQYFHLAGGQIIAFTYHLPGKSLPRSDLAFLTFS